MLSDRFGNARSDRGSSRNRWQRALLLLLLAPLANAGYAQRKVQAESLTRTTTRQERRPLPYGGTLSLFGAPHGSITIEAWPRAEAEIAAEMEMRADSEEDLAQLARVIGFVIDEEPNHLRIFTTGTHDRRTLKRLAPDFPQRLLEAAWKVDYRVRVPPQTDLEIYAGNGTVHLSGVEGAINLNVSEGDVTLEMTGGSVVATVGRGSLKLRLPAPSWRGRGADLRLANGEMTIEIPASLNAEVSARVLRTGRIVNEAKRAVNRSDLSADGKSWQARFGAGGATFSFTVGDGLLRFAEYRDN
ncbi:DUF4097 family beta strand repeat-containing protein [Pyrinomonas methylaliphatogenes]|jgi:hypothetical protein|uniref:Adhesin domain-containing protein n=1 Tax=Pyrinomonas methylaliphatogenes TaxID=454194 RepID=A0A0B6X202_9BACT|nr:hypothetical protein [Pyrinomonas methylaliphatogenes]MBX5477601.1 hypothetical protein [Pyrinomonas methylaliphatogenes]CDM66564.1 Domain of unknown function (DUF4098) [Pyrinomonas methylaliphatogenes]